MSLWSLVTPEAGGGDSQIKQVRSCLIWLPPPPASGVTRDHRDMSHTPGQILQLKKREGPPVFMLLKIYFLFLIYFIPGISCGYVNSTAYGSHKASRIERFFGLFNIVSFRDDECNSSQGKRGAGTTWNIYILHIYTSKAATSNYV